MSHYKMDATYQEDFFNIGIRCCISNQSTTLGSLKEIEYASDEERSPVVAPKPPALRPRISSKMPSILMGSKKSVSSYTIDENNGDDSNVPHSSGSVTSTQVKQSVAHKHFSQRGQDPQLFLAAPTRKKSHDSLPGCTSNAHIAQSVAHEHFMQGPQKSLLDEDDGDVYGDICRDGTDTTCSESCPPSPYAVAGHATPQDALALEVGHNAFEYLEECFYTEVSVLDREKFNAIPEIVKSDFTIREHLGKGNFSDVFEVVRKGGPPLESAIRNIVPVTPPPASNRRRASRARRSTMSVSITTATLAKPSCGERQSVFALKCLRPGIRSDADQFTIGAEDLVHETAILATLDHRHIIKLHGRASGSLTDAFVLNDGYFILLDRLSETLYDRFCVWKENPECTLQGPTLPQIEVAHSVADAMSYLHSKKIVFRDLKPDNVGFDSVGVLKLFDFGFACGLPEKDESNPAGFLFDRCGTPRYMAPEVGLSLGYGLTADMYSFGIFLWELCALAKPFSSITSSTEFERAVFMGGKRPPTEDHWPTAMKQLMISCWSASPSKRPTDWMGVKSSLSLLMMNGNGETKTSARAARSNLAQSQTAAKTPAKVARPNIPQSRRKTEPDATAWY